MRKFTVAALALWGLLSAPVALWAEGEKGTPRLGTGASADWLGGHAEYEFFRDAGKAGGQSAVGGTASGDGLTLKATSHATDGAILFFTDGTTERLRLTETGSIGLGTSIPAALFSVGSNSPFRVDLLGNLTRINDVEYSFPALPGGAGTILTNDGAGALTWEAAAAASGWIDDGADVRLTTIGDNVGIGTATPSSKLEVAGTVTATAFAGDGSSVTAVNAATLDSLDSSDLAILDGQAGGQTLNGGTGASENLTLQSTSHVTPGNIVLSDPLYSIGNVGIGTAPGNYTTFALTARGRAQLLSDALDAEQASFLISVSHATDDGSLNFLRSRGTQDAPTDILATDTVGTLTASGYVDGAYRLASGFQFSSPTLYGSDVDGQVDLIIHDGNVAVDTTVVRALKDRLELYPPLIMGDQTVDASLEGAFQRNGQKLTIYASGSLRTVAMIETAQTWSGNQTFSAGASILSPYVTGNSQLTQILNDATNVPGLRFTSTFPLTRSYSFGFGAMASGNVALFTATTTADRTYTFQDADGTVAFLSDIVVGSSGWTDDGADVRLTTITDNVGIGTATPASKLHVVGAQADNVGAIRVDAPNSEISFFNGTGTQNGVLNFSGTVGNPFRIERGDGTLGVLQVNLPGGATVYSLGIPGTTQTATFPAATGTLALLDGVIGGQTMIGGTASGDDLTLRATSHATDGDIVFQSDGTPTETMRITSAGLVGIGTTSPDILLHVNGAAQVGDPSTTTGSLAFYHASNAFASTFTASASASSSASYTLPVDDGTSGQLLTTDGVGVLTWSSVAAASGWTDGGTFVYLTTLSDNVGIGTASIDADISGVLGNVKLNIASNATMNYHQSWIGNSANTEGAVIASLKTRSDGTDADSIVLNGDSVGRWEGYAADGAAYQRLAAIEMEVDGVPGNVDMPGRIVFSTTPDGSGSLGMLERWRITQAGNLFSATASRVVVGSANDDFDGDVTGTLGGVKLGALSSGISNYHAALVGNGANTSPAFLAGMKTRGVGSDANTVVVSGDGLFQIEAYGADGASYQRAAAIQFASDGTPGTSDMPGRIVFSTTPDGSGGAAMAERMRITNAGNVGIGATGPDRLLDVLDSANPQMRLTQTDGVNYTDLQTGSAGNLAITASGGNITTTGNVGIGSTLPGRQLDVFHASNPQIRVSNTAAIYAEAQETGAGNLVFTLTGGTGNVGIGSAVPAKKLSITGAVEYSTDNGLNPIGQTDAAGANGGTLTNSPTTGDPAFWLRVTINGTNYAIPAWTVP